MQLPSSLDQNLSRKIPINGYVYSIYTSNADHHSQGENGKCARNSCIYAIGDKQRDLELEAMFVVFKRLLDAKHL